MVIRDERGRVSFGRWDFLIQALIILSLISFSLETLPDLSDWWRSALRWVEVVTVIIFSAEYLLRLTLCRPRFSYAFSFFGLVDLFAILPFYISSGVDLRSLRALRLLRLFRLLKLARYGKAMHRLGRAFVSIREELVLFGVITVIMLFLASVGIYYFESEEQPESFASVFHCLWWAIITFTTVGYGDVLPITVGGRIFTGVLLVIGVGIVAVPTGLFAAALSKAKEDDEENDR